MDIMNGSSKLWYLTSRYITNIHTPHHIYVYTHYYIFEQCASVLTNEMLLGISVFISNNFSCNTC